MEAKTINDDIVEHTIASLCVGVQEMAHLHLEVLATDRTALVLVKGDGPIVVTGKLKLTPTDRQRAESRCSDDDSSASAQSSLIDDREERDTGHSDRIAHRRQEVSRRFDSTQTLVISDGLF